MLRRYVNIFGVLLLLTAGLWSGHAAANCNFAAGSTTGYYTIILPGAVTIPRDTPTDISIVSTGSFNVPGSFWVSGCVNASAGVVNARGPNAPSPGIYQPIGNTGLAWTWYWVNQYFTSYGIYVTGLDGGGGIGGAQEVISLVRIGPIAPGTRIPAGVLGSFNTGDLQNIVVSLGNDIVFTELACTTPDVTVPLGTHSASEFGGPNAFTSSTSFNINLQSCPAGMNGITYQIDPTTTVLNTANSVVALDASFSSPATGVGVQLLSDAGTPLPLSTPQTLNGYSSATGGDYTIPLKARYYQTGAIVGPGAANTSMTFTMSYQ